MGPAILRSKRRLGGRSRTTSPLMLDRRLVIAGVPNLGGRMGRKKQQRSFLPLLTPALLDFVNFDGAAGWNACPARLAGGLFYGHPFSPASVSALQTHLRLRLDSVIIEREYDGCGLDVWGSWAQCCRTLGQATATGEAPDETATDFAIQMERCLDEVRLLPGVLSRLKRCACGIYFLRSHNRQQYHSVGCGDRFAHDSEARKYRDSGPSIFAAANLTLRPQSRRASQKVSRTARERLEQQFTKLFFEEWRKRPELFERSKLKETIESPKAERITATTLRQNRGFDEFIRRLANPRLTSILNQLLVTDRRRKPATPAR